MKKHKVAIAVVFTLLFALLQPICPVYAASKNFSYAEQKTGVSVQVLFLEPGEQVDLKFIGINDYRNYSLKWRSTNEAVAVVDSGGVITARANGIATVYLQVGDGSAYSSNGVQITVGEKNNIFLGTSRSNIITTADLELGNTLDLGFYGVTDWNPLRYSCAWVSTNPSAATVDQSGIVTPHKAGTKTCIEYCSAKLNYSGGYANINTRSNSHTNSNTRSKCDTSSITCSGRI